MADERRVGGRVGDDDEAGATVAAGSSSAGRSCWRTVSIDTSWSANAGATWASTPGRSGDVEADVVAGAAPAPIGRTGRSA